MELTGPQGIQGDTGPSISTTCGTITGVSSTNFTLTRFRQDDYGEMVGVTVAPHSPTKTEHTPQFSGVGGIFLKTTIIYSSHLTIMSLSSRVRSFSAPRNSSNRPCTLHPSTRRVTMRPHLHYTSKCHCPTY